MIKIITDPYLIDRFQKRAVINDDSLKTEKYSVYSDYFGRENFGVLLSEDVRREMRTGERAPVYNIGENGVPYRGNQTGLNSDLLMVNILRTRDTPFPSNSDINEFFDYFDFKKNQGLVKNFINSRKSFKLKDKISAIELREQGFPAPKTYHFNNYEDMSNFLGNTNENYIMKPRYGEKGRGIEKVSKSDLERLVSYDLDNYIFQEFLNIDKEVRLVYFNGEFINSREVVFDRKAYEVGGKTFGRQQKYRPSEELIQTSKKLLKYTDTCFGAVDWAITKEGKPMYLEFNGSGTNTGNSNYSYNIALDIAKRIKGDFLNG